MASLFLKDYRTVSVIGVVGLMGYITDYFLFPASIGLMILNICCIGFTTAVLLFHLVKKPSADLSLSLFAIILLINLLVAPFLQLHEPDFSSFYMRNSLIFWVIMPLLGLTIHKRMFLISTIIYLVQFAVILSISKNEFLSNSSGTIFLVLIGYIYVILFLLRTIEISSSKAESLIEDLREKNIELNKSKQELHSLVKTKDKLFSIIAHDLQSPFMGINGLSELIKTSAQQGKTHNIIEYSEMISNTTVRTNTLFTNLLDWSANQTGDFKMKPLFINLDILLTDVIGILHDHQQKKNISIDRKNTDIEVYADPNGLKTILRNLLSNALKFTPDFGQVTISAIKFDDKTVISILDTGIGIKNEILPKIFKNDVYITTQGTNREKGTGLGLSLCKDLIEKHNGSIWVESDSKEGAKFCISLPNNQKNI